jgi:hypothetical protein
VLRRAIRDLSAVIPERQHTSTVADVCNSIVPISGKPEIGVASPEPMTTDRGYAFRVLGLQPSPGMTNHMNWNFKNDV